MEWNSKQKNFELGMTFTLHPNSIDAQYVWSLNQLYTHLFNREYIYIYIYIEKTVLFLLLSYVHFLNFQKTITLFNNSN